MKRDEAFYRDHQQRMERFRTGGNVDFNVPIKQSQGKPTASYGSHKPVSAGSTPAPATHVRLVLPWPPTGNHGTKHGGGAHYLTAEHKAYRSRVASIVAQTRTPHVPSPYTAHVVWYPPDRRERDSDNAQKILFDALVKAGVISNDSFADKRTYREDVVLPASPREGYLIITLQPFVGLM